METVMKDQLSGYFEENNLFLDRQHGFRKGRSTTSAILSLVEHISEAFEEGESVNLTLCDLSKAFDCVSHTLLLRKLSHYGIGGNVHCMLSSYLENRRQMVTLDGASSSIRTVEHGVPQGSVLGPLLFLILVNDLDLDGNSLLFADDTTLTTRGKDIGAIERDAAEVLRLANNWFKINRLQLNEDKTQQLICTLKRDTINRDLEAVKLLGFWLDSKLTWKTHISNLCTRLARVVYLLRKLRRQVSEPYLVAAYHAFFHSHINYGLVLWGHSGACAEVLKLQKKAVRIITFSGQLDHCRNLFTRLGILTVYGQYILNSVVLVRQNLNRYPARSNIHGYNTRHADDLDVLRTRLHKSSRSFPHLAVKLFNSLPQLIRNLEGTKLKTVLHKELNRRPIYSLKELEEEPLFSNDPPPM